MKKHPFNMVPLAAAVALASGAVLHSQLAVAAIEEIVVTANKRAESANDIGMSIATASGDALSEQQLSSLEDITSVVPGLVFSTNNQGTPILTMRGVGFNESSLGVYPTVSSYVDEIPLPFPAMAAHSGYDLERIEVLKGPQGVLFGQNSTGGAINYIAAKPGEDFAYGATVGYSRFNKSELNGFVNAPLSEKAAARLAVHHVSADEWQKSPSHGEENGAEEFTAARLSLSFAPNDTTQLAFTVNGWRDESDPQALQLVAVTPKRFDLAPAQAANEMTSVFSDESARAADWSPFIGPRANKEFIQASARGDFDLSDSTTLTALLAYSDFERDQTQDGDGVPLVISDFTVSVGDIQSTFAEVRIAGDDGGQMRWVFGANYEDSSTYEDQVFQYTDNTSHRASALYINRSGSRLGQEIESYAVFGNVDYDLTENLTAKVGARFTDTTIDASGCGWAPINADGVPDNSGGSGSNVARLFDILGGRSARTFDSLQVGECFTLDANAGPSGATPDPAYGIPGTTYTETLAEDNVSWRLGLDYMMGDTLVYANISQGYKAGSFPVLSAATFNELGPVTEESVLGYEAGFKASLLESTVQVNAAAFLYDYEDKQVRGKTPDPIFGPVERLVNIPESTIAGVETDIIAQLSENLTLTAAVTYINAEVDKYQGYSVLGANPSDPANNGSSEDLSSNSLPYTPQWTYSLGLDYRAMLASGGSWFAGITAVGQSESDAVFNGDDIALPQDRIDAGTAKSLTRNYFVIDDYYTVNARVGYESADEHWKVVLWGKNITDEYYYTTVIASSDTAERVAGRPATYGLTVGYQY